MNKGKIAEVAVGKKTYVGLDVHRKSFAVTVLQESEVIKKWTMPADPEKLSQILKREYGSGEIYSAYEAGFSGFGLHRVLVESGINNIVVHAASIAVSSGDRVKTDKRDSVKIAKQLSAGLLKGIRVPTIEEELRRQLSRTRQQLIKDRTRVMVQIRRRLYLFGFDPAQDGILQRKWVREILSTIPESSSLRWSVESHLKLWDTIEGELRSLEKRLSEQAKQCPYEAVYRTVPGIGRISSRILANELGDMTQFRNEKALFSYVGLTPTEHSSGEQIRRGHISRQGKPTLRKILVEAAWVAVRRDPEVRSYYCKLSVRVGAKRAVVAVARKLIGRARALFRKGEGYREGEVAIAA